MYLQTPLLSVTILNYNYGHFLPACLDSILSQDFSNYEIILINDKSSDNSLEVITPYLHDNRIRLVDHLQNKGFVASLIEGVQLSIGRYITVISADDWILTKNAFTQQIALLEQDPEVAFVYTAYGHYNNDVKASYIWRSGFESYIRTGREAFQDLVLNPFLLHSGTIIRKTAYEESGGYDPHYKHSVDTKLWLALCKVGKVGYIDELHYAYRYHNSNMSKNVKTVRRAIEEVLAALEWAFSKFSQAEQSRLAPLKKKAESRALVAFVIDDIFSSHYRAGWRSYITAFKLRPFQTLLQRATLYLTLRTILGEKGYWLLEKFKAKFDSRTRTRLNISTADRNYLRNIN